MRHDMSQVIIDRPRYDGGRKRKGRLPRDLQDGPRAEGMRRPYGYWGKEFSDHLGPLKRYLRKHVGRPWNKVYGEICAHLRAGNPVDDHVKKHLADFIAFHVTMNADGTPRDRIYPDRGGIWQHFYVHPRSGLLCINKAHKRP